MLCLVDLLQFVLRYVKLIKIMLCYAKLRYVELKCVKLN